jgi:hypothetical protein
MTRRGDAVKGGGFRGALFVSSELSGFSLVPAKPLCSTRCGASRFPCEINALEAPAQKIGASPTVRHPALGFAIMDREIVLQRLARAEGHVVLGERHLAEQRARVERFERNGYHASNARSFLLALEESQHVYVEHRDCLLKELSDAPSP